MSLREVNGADADAVRAFFDALTEQDRTFFWDDISDPAVAQRWLADGRRHCTVAEDDGSIAAFASLVPLTNWSGHVAELVLVVGGWARRQGHGRALAQAMLIGALQQGFTKVTVNVSAERNGAIEMFQSIGFRAEALLVDHLRTPETGELTDLIILSHLVEETYSEMLTAGMDSVTG
jgi:L-amino acid N-acyltransferase YncA